MGNGSTTLLHEILKDTDRKLVSVEDNASWAEKFVHLKSKNHEIHVNEGLVNGWNSATDEYAKEKWGVVFVDQGPGGEITQIVRNYSVRKLIDCADYVVAHDGDLFPEMQSEEYSCFTYFPSRIEKESPYAEYIAARGGPTTYIFSKKHDLKNIVVAEP